MENSISNMRPELVKEWSEKNYPLTPDCVPFGSNKLYWWRGSCGHEWQTSAKARSYKLMNWDRGNRYKVLGRIANSAEGLILVFDLEEAIMFDALPEEYVDKRTGELKKRIKVYYPEKYEGRIGNYYHDYVATEQISMFENLNEYEDGQNGEAQTATPSATEEMASTQDSPYQRTAPMPGGALNE